MSILYRATFEHNLNTKEQLTVEVIGECEEDVFEFTAPGFSYNEVQEQLGAKFGPNDYNSSPVKIITVI